MTTPRALRHLWLLGCIVLAGPGQASAQFDHTDLAFLSQSSTLRNGLVGYWRLEESSGTRYAAHGTNHLTDVNTVTSNPGILDTAAQLTSASSEKLESLAITNNGNPLSIGGGAFTVSVWARFDTKPAVANIIAMGGASAVFETFRIRYWSTPDRIQFIWGTNAAVSVSANALGSPSTATWYHCLAWHDAAGTAYIRINGGSTNSGSTAATAITPNYNAFLRIGAQYSSEYFNGRVDEVGVWNRVLTSAEQTAIYTNSASAIAARRYPF